MNTKSIITILLLIFVAVSVVYLVTGNKQADTEASVTETAVEPSSTPENHQIIAYYYHGNRRCKTCRTIEAYAAEAIQTGFADALDAGQVDWQVLNFEDSANAGAVEDYDLVSQSLIIVEWQDGEKLRWKNLERVWKLVGEKKAFLDYVQQEVAAYLGET